MDRYGFFTHKQLRLLTGLIMFVYITIHLLNHGLGIISLTVAEAGLRLEMAFWHTSIMTLLLYGAVAIHFLLALWTLYSRADWRLPWVEILRLVSGFSFPLLLINHAVTTRLGDALFGIKPSYALIIANLLAAGMQGMQIALMAPGWLHGCLGLWVTLRRFRAMQRIKGLLAALVVIVPLLAATGFLRMTSEVLAMGAPPTGSDAMLHKTALASWGTNLVGIYLGAIFVAFFLGRLRPFLAPTFQRYSAPLRGTTSQYSMAPTITTFGLCSSMAPPQVGSNEGELSTIDCAPHRLANGSARIRLSRCRKTY
jgi:adenylate cyclase